MSIVGRASGICTPPTLHAPSQIPPMDTPQMPHRKYWGVRGCRGGVSGVSLAADPPAPGSSGDPQEQLVRHFLIETGPRGVKIRGCPEEPYFGEGGTDLGRGL